MNRKFMNIVILVIAIFTGSFYLFGQTKDTQQVKKSFEPNSGTIKTNNNNVIYSYTLDESKPISIRQNNTFDVNFTITNPTNQNINQIIIQETKNSQFIPKEISNGTIKSDNKSNIYTIENLAPDETRTITLTYEFTENDPVTRLIEDNPFIYIVLMSTTLYGLFLLVDKIRKKRTGKELSLVVKDHLYLVMVLAIIYQFGLELLAELFLRIGLNRNATLFLVLITFPLVLYLLEKLAFSKDAYTKTTYKNSVLIIFVVIMVTQLFTLAFDSNNKEQLIVITQTVVGMNIYMRLTAMQKIKHKNNE